MRLSRIVMPTLAIVFALVTSPASAQAPARNLDELRLKVQAGDMIYVTEEGGRERAGRIVDLSPAALTVSFDGAPRVLSESSILRIRQRQSDSLWMGGVIGAGVGLGLGVASASFSEECSHHSTSSGCIGPVLLMTGLSAAVGIGIDAMIQGRTVVYETPRLSAHVSPLMSPGGMGVRLSVQFSSRR